MKSSWRMFPSPSSSSSTLTDATTPLSNTTIPKRAWSLTSGNFNLRASLTFFKPRLSSVESSVTTTGGDPNRDDDGGDAVEEVESVAVKPRSSKSKHLSSGLKEGMSRASSRLSRVGSAISETVSKITGNGGRKTATKQSDSVLEPCDGYTLLPEPPKNRPPPNHQPVKKLTHKEKEEQERVADVVGFLNGSKTLSSRFTDNFKLGELLGEGAFGFVMTATELKSGREVAVKFIARNKISRDLWVKNPSNPSELIPVEIAVLQQVNHPNIIQYIDHVVEATKYILLITELHGTEWTSSHVLPKAAEPTKSFKTAPSSTTAAKARASTAQETSTVSAPSIASFAKLECSPLHRLSPEQEKMIKRRTSCDLFECIDAHKRLPEFRAKQVFAQIALAVKHLHDRNLVHRDLKDENIVIDAHFVIKLIDFGSAAQIPTREEDYFTKFNGTTHFASPEIANDKPYRGPESEMWSLGVLLYTIVFGENPFQNIRDTQRAEYRMPFGLESDDQFEGCRHLINRLLTYNVKERITIDQVLEHKWLRDEVQRYQALYDAAS
ncbi:hypothetical protein HDU98_005878 [Podochytrium sp. JEL0797]|nr:hypothetical protein HDU98_005878 [Podochytrium sp. JEL0797]